MDGIATREGRRAVPYGLALRDQAAGDVLAVAPVCRDEREHVVRARLEWRLLIEPRLVVPVIGVELGRRHHRRSTDVESVAGVLWPRSMQLVVHENVCAVVPRFPPPRALGCGV